MGQTKLRGNTIQTSGDMPAVGSKAPDFSITRQDLSQATLETFAGKKKLLNIYPSLDTGICALSVKTFNSKAGDRDDLTVLNVSADLPFASKRFCAAEGIVTEALSTFRSSFAVDYGIEIMEGPMAGLCARCVVVLDENDQVLYTEMVEEIATEPNYDAALAALG